MLVAALGSACGSVSATSVHAPVHASAPTDDVPWSEGSPPSPARPLKGALAIEAEQAEAPEVCAREGGTWSVTTREDGVMHGHCRGLLRFGVRGALLLEFASGPHASAAMFMALVDEHEGTTRFHEIYSSFAQSMGIPESGGSGDAACREGALSRHEWEGVRDGECALTYYWRRPGGSSASLSVHGDRGRLAFTVHEFREP